VKYRLNEVQEDKLLSNYEPIDNITNYKEFLEENIQIKLLKEKIGILSPDFCPRIFLLAW